MVINHQIIGNCLGLEGFLSQEIFIAKTGRVLGSLTSMKCSPYLRFCTSNKHTGSATDVHPWIKFGGAKVEYQFQNLWPGQLVLIFSFCLSTCVILCKFLNLPTLKLSVENQDSNKYLLHRAVNFRKDYGILLLQPKWNKKKKLNQIWNIIL